MRSTTDFSRFTAASRRFDGGRIGKVDPELISRAEALESMFDRGSTAYLEDVLPELEELRQLLERQLRGAAAEDERASTWSETCAESDDRQPRLCREFARLVDDARSRCLGVPNPSAFRWVADRFSSFRVALEAEPASREKGVGDLFS